jgi:predicted transcriptional regulator of viral defense system
MQLIASFDIEWFCDLLRAEYREMPGLCLTRRQVQRLWNLDASESDAVLSRLVSKGFLRRAGHGEYVLAARQKPSHELVGSDANG